MALKGLKSVEVSLWAVWIGSIWFLGVLGAPALFNWLPRPEAGLVAGRFFYMMSWYSLVMGLVLVAVCALRRELGQSRTAWVCMGAVVVVSLTELLWLHPHMQEMRELMASLNAEAAQAVRADFGNMHAVSSVLYAIKMIAGLVWGILLYGAVQERPKD